MSFSNLGLSTEIVRAVSEKGYRHPTPVQAQAIPVILEGRDIMAGAQTGTGKTAGFTLPLLHRLSTQPHSVSSKKPPVRALILTPTRELAAQIGESVTLYGKYLSLKSAVIFGGVNINPQIKKLNRGVDILIATPGRLLDLVNQQAVSLSRVETLVLDEADRMLDMGFIRDIRKIIALLPDKGRGGRQNLLFSATFSDQIRQLASGLLHDPAYVEVARRNTTVETVTQTIHPVDRTRKAELLAWLIGSNNWSQVLVFTRTKHGANKLTTVLEKSGIKAAAIHGNKSQGARTRALADFKKGSISVLVATDIAARGLDIDQLPHVINYELPNVPEDYVHRIGRTGRAGHAGEAISLVCVDERDFLRGIERLIKREIPRVVIEGFEPDPTIKAEPVFKKRQPQRPSRAKTGKSGNQNKNRARNNNRSQSTAANRGPSSRGNQKKANGNQSSRRAA
ncbi:MAG: DEAD/DEAH box helicase [Gammaproteobacteria bacterium]|nr:MAG: DEAD/DEAH box helicase [Gammaproteobacteria bacterium]